ncbi:hypothetical protein [Actinomadura sp. 9N407]|uniref:hypothetical protein n=1 Tax=Actinomadura sp. 9N407 TaxID=3375154 RepID=UPI0037B9CA4F
MNASDLAQVLFTTTLQASEHPTDERVREVIGRRLRGGEPGRFAAYVAQEAGDHPEAYAERMRWAIATVDRAYAPSRPVPGRPAVRRRGRRGLIAA